MATRYVLSLFGMATGLYLTGEAVLEEAGEARRMSGR